MVRISLRGKSHFVWRWGPALTVVKGRMGHALTHGSGRLTGDHRRVRPKHPVKAAERQAAAGVTTRAAPAGTPITRGEIMPLGLGGRERRRVRRGIACPIQGAWWGRRHSRETIIL